jgi:hypothetical protein
VQEGATVDASTWLLREHIRQDALRLLGDAGAAIEGRGDLAAVGLALDYLLDRADHEGVDADWLDLRLTHVAERLGVAALRADIRHDRLLREEWRRALLPFVVEGEQVRRAVTLWNAAASRPDDEQALTYACSALLEVENLLRERDPCSRGPATAAAAELETGAEQPAAVGGSVRIGGDRYRVVHDGSDEPVPFLGLLRETPDPVREPACLEQDPPTGLATLRREARPAVPSPLNVYWRGDHVVDLSALSPAATLAYVRLRQEGQSATESYPAARRVGTLAPPEQS